MEIINCKSVENSVESLKVVDCILRLGIEYHFEEEIEAILQRQYKMLIDSDYQCCDDEDLNLVALRFRLLRQQGYHVSSGNFQLLLINFYMINMQLIKGHGYHVDQCCLFK